MSNIQHTYALLQQIYALMQQIETQGQRTEQQVKKNIEYSKELESAVLKYMVVARHAGLPTVADDFIQKISMMILAAKSLEQTIVLTKAALVSSGPVGWIVLGASVAYTALSFYSLGNR